MLIYFFFQAEDGIRDDLVTGVQTCALPISLALPVPVTRLGHGVRAVEDPELVRELAARGTVLEVCPTSNVVLSAYPGYPEHPFPLLRAAGVRVTLGGDDRRRVRGRAEGVGTGRRGAARGDPHGDRGGVRSGRPPICALSANSAMI